MQDPPYVIGNGNETDFHPTGFIPDLLNSIKEQVEGFDYNFLKAKEDTYGYNKNGTWTGLTVLAYAKQDIEFTCGRIFLVVYM